MNLLNVFGEQKKLELETRKGDFVHKNQTMAKDDGFRNVSKIWLDKTLTYEQGFEQLRKEKSETEDLMIPLKQINFDVDSDGNFTMVYNGKGYKPTMHALTQMAKWADCGTYIVTTLASDKTKNDGATTVYSRDYRDAETLVRVMQNGMRRIDPNKKFLWRTRKDGTLRAMLTDSYAIVNNEWLLEMYSKIIPNGRLSHWRGDSDTIYGNVLIPDTIRQEDDSDYGGLLSIGNSEIGERRLSSMPSIYRAICMNGCIWDRVDGALIAQVHRGKIDLYELIEKIRENVNVAIPLIPQIMETMLMKKEFKYAGQMKSMFAQIVTDNKLSKKEASAVLDSYHTEVSEVKQNHQTLFGVINAFTRAGQKLSNKKWIDFDTIGGKLSEYSLEQWQHLSSKANKWKVEETEAVFANAV